MATHRMLERELHRLRLQLALVPDCPTTEVSPETAAVPPPTLPVAPDPVPTPEPDPPPPEPEMAAAPPFEPPQPASRPTAPPRPVPPPPPEPDTAPPDDRLRIPEDVDRTRDLTFLAGCWRTDPFRHSPAQGSPGTSTYCFDAEGRGSLTFRRSGIACTAPAHVEILPGGRLRIWDANTVCNDGTLWFQDRLDCAGAGGGVAQCSGESDGDVRWVVNLHRV